MYKNNNYVDAVSFLREADRSMRNVKVSARSEVACNCCCSSHGGGKAKYEEKMQKNLNANKVGE